MVGQNVKSLQRVLDTLLAAEMAALDKIADDNSEANRSVYLEIHEVLETVRSELHKQGSSLMKALRFLHLIP